MIGYKCFSCALFLKNRLNIQMIEQVMRNLI